jgi:hypothetical protein
MKGLETRHVAVLVVLLSMVAVFPAVLTAGTSPVGLVAAVGIHSERIVVTPKTGSAGISLTVCGPDGSVSTVTFDPGSEPVIAARELVDGSYSYELRPIPTQTKVRVEGAGDGDSVAPLVQSGTFRIVGGEFVLPTTKETGGERALAAAAGAVEDQVIADDLIVTGSLCVGFDCVDGEAFGFDTIRLKENNLRIRFDDTSAIAGFPANDWQIVANDSASGGDNFLAFLDDITARYVFKVQAGAPSNSLFVSSSGRVGIKTSTPVLDLHLLSGNTPGVRLDQDGTVGFSPQIWDVAGNEANFFVRDVTGGSRLPFRIQPGAPTNTLYLKADGKIGAGTSAPAYPLELVTTGSNATMVANRTDGAKAFLGSTPSAGLFGTFSDHPVRIFVHNTWKMRFNTDNSVDMVNGASLTSGGVWTDACSREYKENIQALSTDAALFALERLSPVTYNYRVDQEDRHVGFIAEDSPELVVAKDRKGMSPMDVVAVLTKVVQEQQRAMQDQQRTIDMLHGRIDQLEKKVQ